MQGKFKYLPLALASIMALGQPVAEAGETVDLGNGVKFDWSLSTIYALGVRTKSPNPLLASDDTNFTGNDGNNNFQKGSITTNRLSALFESKLTKGESGFVLTGSTFYDQSYRRPTGYDGSSMPNTPPPYNRFTYEAKHYNGGYSRMLDTYAFTTLNLGEGRKLDLRVGRQVVNWGEANYFANISGAQGPFDGGKSDIPGTEVKEAILPEDQVSASLQLSSNLMLLAHWQYGFHPTLIPPVGAFQSTDDVLGPGGSCMGAYRDAKTCSGLARMEDKRPKDAGQWGVGGRYRISNETELGLYYLNYNDRSPALIFSPDFESYHVRYFDDVKMLAGTVSTSFGKIAAYGELSYRQDTPVMVNMRGMPDVPAYVRGNVTQLNVGGFYNIGRTSLADDMQLLAEVSAVKVNGLSEGYGFSDLFFQTRDSVALSGSWIWSYPGIAESWDLSIPLSYSHQLRGRSLVGSFGGGQGDRRYSVGASFTKDSNFTVSVTYVGYLGSASLDSKTDRSMVDRDQLSITAKYMF